MIETEDASPALRDVVRTALASLETDGRLSATATAELRRWGEEADPASFPAQPEEMFGAWSELPPAAERTLRAWAEDDIRRGMDRYPSGPAWTGAVRAARSCDRILVDVGGPPALRRAAVSAASRLHGGRRSLGRRLDRRAALRRWASAPRVGLPDLVARLGRGPEWLLADWARGVRVDRRARGLHQDRRRRVAWAHHLGLDLMIADDGVILVESNIEPGIPPPHLRPDIDYPLAEVVTDVASSRGFRRLVWIEADRLPMHDYMLVELVERARARGLLLDVLEDPCMPRRRALPAGADEPGRWRAGLAVPDRTLVLRRNSYPVGPDLVLGHKEPSLHALAGRFEARGERRVRVVRMSREPRDFEPARGPGLPNLVYKFPDSFASQGVFFMRARDAGHALGMARELDRRHGEPPGLFQPFIRARTVEGRAYHVRADLVIAPFGPVYCGGRRLVAGRSLPLDLHEGLSTERGAYASNVSGGGYLARLAPEEEPLVRDATLAVGEAFIDVLNDTFVMT